MQDKYVSLDPNPEVQRIQNIHERRWIIEEQRKEAYGGPLPSTVGFTYGLTGALIMYMRAQRSGFTLFPLARHKAYYYVQIWATYFLLSRLGHAQVSFITGNDSKELYLALNQIGIQKG